MTLVPPEMELVVSCSRLDPGPGTLSRIRAMAATALNWDRVLAEATAHSVMPLLYRNLSGACADTVPESKLSELREDFHRNAAALRMLTSRLVAIVDVLERAGIPAIPIKGPVLAASAYGDIGLRQWGDLDLMVAPRAYRHASEVLLETGFREVKQHGWQATFYDQSGPVMVDLHRAVTESRFPVRLDFDELWARRSSVVLENRPVPNLSPEDTLLILCIQLVKDGWDRRVQLSRVADVAQVQWAWSDLDRHAVAERARRVGARLMLQVGLQVAHQVLDGPKPGPWSPNPAEDRVVADLAERIRGDLLVRPVLRATRGRRQHRFHFRARERVRDKLFPYAYLPHYWRAHLRRLVVPGDRDRALVSLPPALSFLYYGVRPLRVVADRVRPRSGRATMRVHRTPGLDFRFVDDRVVFFDEAGCEVVTLNSLGTQVWQALDEHGDPRALADHLVGRFNEVDRAQLEQDIRAFLQELRELGLVLDGADQ